MSLLVAPGAAMWADPGIPEPVLWRWDPPGSGLGAIACDPFWSEMNGACSNEFGNYVRPDGTEITPDELVATIDARQAEKKPDGGAPDLSAWVKKNALALGAAVFAIALVGSMRGRR